MKKIISPILLLMLLITSTNSFSSEQDSYGSQVGEKALNGFTNMTTAIIEIPKNIINSSNDAGLFLGLPGGLIKGIINTVGRTLVGVTDLITAPIPTHPIAMPAYVWDKFDIDTSYNDEFRLKASNIDD